MKKDDVGTVKLRNMEVKSMQRRCSERKISDLW
jgi:hypothetical protein